MFGVRLRVAYDGTDFAGWQYQPGQRTVQGELERVLSDVAGAPITVRGARRTDSGVHAYDQVAAFDTPRELPMIGWVRAVNGKLPDDVAVRAAEPCEVGYNPRFDALAKRYRYTIHLGPVRDPLVRHYSWHLGPRRARPWRDGTMPVVPEDWLDLDAMSDAAELLVGEHDVGAFQAAGDIRENTVRTLTEVSVVRRFEGRDDLVAIEVRGTAFLQHMVRIIAGTLVDVGRERMSAAELRAVLQPGASRDRAGETAPSCGLLLVATELGRERLRRA
jgi:tRNA pseudouridine38-40 synthase